MANINELITTIYANEALELDGFLEKEQQIRIEEKIFAAIMEEEFADQREHGKSQVSEIPVSGRRKRRRFLVFGLAAVLLLGLGLTVLGASAPDWDIALIRAMGLGKTDTLQLESGEVRIDETASCNCVEYLGEETKITSVSMTAKDSIGDKNSAFIRLITDYKLPEAFDETTDYILPGESEVHVYQKDPEKTPVVSMMGSSLYSTEEDGYLGFIVEITDCDKLNKSYVNVHFEDLYLYHDKGKDGWEEEKEELLIKGSWDIKWKYEYKSNVKTFLMLVPLSIKGEKYYLNKVEISPISVTIKGFRMPWNRKKEYQDLSLDSICYKDGTIKDIGESQATGCKNGMEFTTFVGIQYLGEPIDTKNVTDIIVNDNRIRFHTFFH